MGQTLLSAFVCIVVIAAIFFLAWFIPRVIASRSGMTGQGRNIRVLEKVAVSKDSYLMLVKVLDELVVVGVTAQGMTVLEKFQAADLKEDMVEPKSESFSEIFRQTIHTAVPDGMLKDTVSRLFRKKGGGDREEK